MSSNINLVAASSPTGIAPTPQNTPAAHLSHSVLSRPQVPSTLSEEVEQDDEEDIQTISTQGVSGLAGLANNPAFAAMVQNRLGSLVGRSSGYVEALPLPIRRRITGLKGVQAQQNQIEAEFQREIYELEKKYAEKYKPLYERRKALVEGKSEPTQVELEQGWKEEDEESDDEDSEDEDSEDEEASGEKVREEAPSAEEIAQAPKGIPEFWLTALKNHLGLSEMELITERDEEALKFLIDIRLEYPAEKPGFRLVFEFSEGAKTFFGNTKLEKTYFYQDEVGYEGDFLYDHAVGTDIAWVEGKDLTVKVETKKQRNKNTNQTRIVKKVVPTDSFFSFFSPPLPPTEDDDEEDDEDIHEKLELDYQIGEDIKERVIPRAVDFFTGKALRHEQQGDDFESDDEFDEEEEEDSDEDSDDDDEDDEDVGSGRRRVKGVRKAPAPPSGNTPASHQDPAECKQS